MMLPLMMLGYFPFAVKTMPFDRREHNKTWTHAENARVGAPPSYQFLGKGAETIQISGVLAAEIGIGIVSLEVLEKMADTGKAFPLMDALGGLRGMYVIDSLRESHSEFYSIGVPRKIEFELSLKRIDDKETGLLAMFGLSNLGSLF